MRTVLSLGTRGPVRMVAALLTIGVLGGSGLSPTRAVAGPGDPNLASMLDPAHDLSQRRWDDDDCRRIRVRGERVWVCDDDDDDHGRRGRGHRRGDYGRWSRFWHDDFGDCFGTPWGLACETQREGVYRVRDRHRGDEPGPDCDLLFVEPWGWRCYDSPRR